MSTVRVDKAQGPLVVTLDMGSSSVRVVVFDRMGRELKDLHACRDHELRATAEGAAEFDAGGLLDLVWQCLDQVVARLSGSVPPIAGVASCSIVGNVLGVDNQFRPLTPVYTYADTRARSDAAALKRSFNPEAVHQRTGCPFHSAYLPARLRWLSRTEHELFQRVARWMSLGEYMEWRLFGQAAVSYSVASWSGLLDRHRLDWDEPLLEGIPLDSTRLSSLNRTSSPRQGLRPEFAARWPVLKDVPWFPTVADGAAANVGSGCLSSAMVALTMGTTGAVRAVLERPVARIPHGLWCYRVDERRSLVGGALSEGGNVVSWLRKMMNINGPGDIDLALSAVEPDSHGLTVLPFLAGERSPGWADDARVTLHGLSLATTSYHIVRAALESVAYRVALVLEMLEGILSSRPQVVASGGALLGSPGWLQIITDVIDRPVTISQVGEASARGAALLALERLGMLAHLEEAPAFLGKTFPPDPGRHAIYREARDRHEELYRRLVRETI